MDGRRALLRLYGWAWETAIALPFFVATWLAGVLFVHRGWWFVLLGSAAAWLVVRLGIELVWGVLVRLIRWGKRSVGPY